MGKRIILLLLILMGCLANLERVGAKQFTLVIDAGHGGGDAGACGAIAKEKDLTLKFALAFGRLVEQNCPDVKVVYTRKTDRFVELYRRAEIANKNKADLFISIHINSLPKGHKAHGFQTYTLGKSRRTGKKTGVMENLEVAKRENAVIYLEKDYKQTYQGYDPNSPESDIMFEFVQDKNMEASIELARYMQKYVCEATGRQDMGAHQDNLAVLRLTSMPGALIELGFISSPDEERFMASQAATNRYARGIYNAFAAYKKKHGGSISVPYLPVAQLPDSEKEEKRVEPVVEKPQTAKPAEKTEKTEKTEADQPVFKVQILTSSSQLKKDDRQLKGVTNADYYKEGSTLKYTVGASANYNEIYQLRKSLLSKFPQAFIIAFKGDKKMDVQEAIREFKQRKTR